MVEIYKSHCTHVVLYRTANKEYSHSFHISAVQCAFKDAVDNIEALSINRFYIITANVTYFG